MSEKQFQKNETVLLRVTDIGSSGEGIGKADGYTLFVRDAVVGDLAEVKITKAKKPEEKNNMLTRACSA